MVTEHNSSMQCSVSIDFGRWVDYPLVKTKFGVFNSGIVRLPRYERDKKFLAEVKPESLRIDLGWGTSWIGWPVDPITGSQEAMQYEFSEMDGIARVLNDAGVLAYWSYCYTPLPLQQPPGEWRSVPSSMEQWGEILRTFAKHYKECSREYRVGYHEVHNEPDNPGVFFLGAIEDYLEMYRTGSLGIRSGDADAVVGGPALAFSPDWIKPFLNYVVQHQLPLDFFSFHWYGVHNWENRTLGETICLVREHFASRPEFATTELHLNEFNSLPVDYPKGGFQEKYASAALLLRDFKYLLEQPDITRIHWAQFMDSGYGNFSGMISDDGHVKAVYNAYKLYTRMPVDRCAVDISDAQGIDAMASRDAHTCCVVMWNDSEVTREIRLILKNLPFKSGTALVFRIDMDHASWGDNPANEALAPVETTEWNAENGLSRTVSIAPHSVIFVELNEELTLKESTVQSVAEVVRVLHYYSDRTSHAYAEFDKNTWIARLGMVDETTALAVIGALTYALPADLTVIVDIDGYFQPNNGALLGIRVDFAVNDVFVSSVLYYHSEPRTGAPTKTESVLNWGTRRQVDQWFPFSDTGRTGPVHLELRESAPDEWSGHAIVSFLMQNTGSGTRARIGVRKTNTTSYTNSL